MHSSTFAAKINISLLFFFLMKDHPKCFHPIHQVQTCLFYYLVISVLIINRLTLVNSVSRKQSWPAVKANFHLFLQLYATSTKKKIISFFRWLQSRQFSSAESRWACCQRRWNNNEGLNWSWRVWAPDSSVGLKRHRCRTISESVFV